MLQKILLIQRGHPVFTKCSSQFSSNEEYIKQKKMLKRCVPFNYIVFWLVFLFHLLNFLY